LTTPEPGQSNWSLLFDILMHLSLHVVGMKTKEINQINLFAYKWYTK
jgi:hypothetical protein